MNAADPEFFRAFAGRVRTTVTTPKGGPAVTTTITATIETTATVPATFQPAARPARQFVVGTTGPKDAPCTVHPWCVETGEHVHHFARRVALPLSGTDATVLTATLYTDKTTGIPALLWDLGHDTDVEFTSGDELREQTAKVRTHLARLDAFADQYDALREAGGQHAQTPPPAVEDNESDPWDEANLPRGAARVSVESDGSGFVLAADTGEAGGELLMTVYSGALSGDLDLAGAREFRARTAGFLAQVDGMIDGMARRETPAEEPRTWSFVDEDSTDPEEVTCMLGCFAPHPEKQMASAPVDTVKCYSASSGAFLPMFAGSTKERTVEILRFLTRAEPFSGSLGRRLPHVSIEVVEDHFIENLDPDGLQVVIDTFQARVDAMRAARLHLIAARTEYMRRAR